MWFTSLVVDGYFKFVCKNAHAHCASHGCVELTHIHVSTTCTHACVSTPHRCTRVSPTTGSCGTNPPTKTLLGACFSWEGSSRHITSLLNQRSSDIASAHHHRSLTCTTRPCVTSNQSSGMQRTTDVGTCIPTSRTPHMFRIHHTSLPPCALTTRDFSPISNRPPPYLFATMWIAAAHHTRAGTSSRWRRACAPT